jgi:chromosome segregation ATPase
VTLQEELTRYKERVEELEAEVAESDSVIPPDTKIELASLRSQLINLRTFSDQSQADNQAVERRLAVIKEDYEGRLHEREVDSTDKIRELEEELNRLDDSLETTHHQLSESMSLNNQLKQQLASALKTSSGPLSPRSSVESLVQLKNKVEWLKKENSQLEERCRQAEEKVSILLG